MALPGWFLRVERSQGSGSPGNFTEDDEACNANGQERRVDSLGPPAFPECFYLKKKRLNPKPVLVSFGPSLEKLSTSSKISSVLELPSFFTSDPEPLSETPSCGAPPCGTPRSGRLSVIPPPPSCLLLRELEFPGSLGPVGGHER